MLSVQTMAQQPSVVYPKLDLVTEDTNLVFSWNPLVGATSYRFQLSTDSNFTTLAEDVPGLTVTDIGPLTSLHTNNRYYWRIIAQIGATSDTSDRAFFTCFIPRKESTSTMWVRADSLITMNGNTVSDWGDLSSTTNNLTQTVASQQPNFVDSVVRHFPAVEFPGGTKFFESTSTVDHTNGYTFFLVGRNTSNQGLNGVYRVANAGNTFASISEIFWQGATNGASGSLSMATNRGTANFKFFNKQNTQPDLGEYYIINIVGATANGTLYSNGDYQNHGNGDYKASTAGTAYLGKGYFTAHMTGEILEAVTYGDAFGDSLRILAQKPPRSQIHAAS